MCVCVCVCVWYLPVRAVSCSVLSESSRVSLACPSALLASCSVLSATCSVLLASCSVLLASCSVLLASCSVLLVSCSVLLVSCSVLLAICSVLFASSVFNCSFSCRRSAWWASRSVRRADTCQRSGQSCVSNSTEAPTSVVYCCGQC